MAKRFNGAAVAAAIAAMALGASPASAATLFTHPVYGISSGTCTEGSPCTLPFAVSKAEAGDEVRLAVIPNNYSGGYQPYYMFSQLDITKPNITIAGPPGRRAISTKGPLLYWVTGSGGSDGLLDSQNKLMVSSSGFKLERLAITGTANGSSTLIGATHSSNTDMELTRVLVRNLGTGITVAGDDVQISDSLIDQPNAVVGSVAAAVTGAIYGSTVRSSLGTAIENSESYHSPTSTELSIFNTIARGGIDLSVFDPPGGSTPHVSIDYSSIANTSLTRVQPSLPNSHIGFGADNLQDSTPPLLDDALMPLWISPSIDAGCDGSCDNNFDLNGRTRPIGAHKDIGAYESSAAPTVGVPSQVGVAKSRSASLRATINPNGEATTYHFEASGGGRTIIGPSFRLPAGETAVTAAGTIPGLQPRTTYRVWAEATNAISANIGSDAAYRTSSDATAPALSGLRLSARSVRARQAVKAGFSISEASGSAVVTVRLEQPQVGHKRGSRCLTSQRTGRRCTFVRVFKSVNTTLRTPRRAALPVPVVISGRPLGRGNYRVKVSAVDGAGNRSPWKSAVFTVR